MRREREYSNETVRRLGRQRPHRRTDGCAPDTSALARTATSYSNQPVESRHGTSAPGCVDLVAGRRSLYQPRTDRAHRLVASIALARWQRASTSGSPMTCRPTAISARGATAPATTEVAASMAAPSRAPSQRRPAFRIRPGPQTLHTKASRPVRAIPTIIVRAALP